MKWQNVCIFPCIYLYAHMYISTCFYACIYVQRCIQKLNHSALETSVLSLYYFILALLFKGLRGLI